MASNNNHIDKPQSGRPKRAELLDVNINTGAQSINTERTSLKKVVTNITCVLHCLLFPLPLSLQRASAQVKKVNDVMQAAKQGQWPSKAWMQDRFLLLLCLVLHHIICSFLIVLSFHLLRGTVNSLPAYNIVAVCFAMFTMPAWLTTAYPSCIP